MMTTSSKYSNITIKMVMHHRIRHSKQSMGYIETQVNDTSPSPIVYKPQRLKDISFIDYKVLYQFCLLEDANIEEMRL